MPQRQAQLARGRGRLDRRLEDGDRLVEPHLRRVHARQRERGGDVGWPIGQDALELGDRVTLAFAGQQQSGQREARRRVLLVHGDRVLQLLLGLLLVALLVMERRQHQDQLRVLRIAFQRRLHGRERLVGPVLPYERGDLRP